MAAKKKKNNNKKKNNKNVAKKASPKVVTTSKEEVTIAQNTNSKESKVEDVEKVEVKNDKENTETKEVISELTEQEKNEETDSKQISESPKDVFPNKTASDSKKDKKKKKDLSVTKIKNVTLVDKEEKKKEKQQDQKEKTENSEKPEYVQEMLKKKKKKMYIIIFTIAIILLIMAFSTIFAIMNLNNTTFNKGVSIKNIDVSGLTIDEARNIILEATEKELSADIEFKYEDQYSTELLPKQIEFEYLVEKAVLDAYSIGRSGNIIANNYAILFTTLFGKNVEIDYNYNDILLTTFIDDMNSNLPGVCQDPTYYIEENQLIITPGVDGIRIRKEELRQQILNLIYSRTASEMIDDSFKQSVDLPIDNVNAEEINMKKIYDEIYTEPKDAYYVLEPYQIFPDVDGVDLVISVEEAQMEVDRENKEEYIFDLRITEAEKTIDELGTEAFPYLISTFSTKYDASNTNRSTNLRIAAEKINGKVLMPGEEFSFNTVVGKRTVEAGYRDAKIYADGGVVDGLAGGICQISSTLYNSVLLANLDIVERKNHTYTTSYVAAGKDATVVYGTKDFKFKNSRNYPIKIEASVKNGVAEFKIHGIEEETEYEVKILPVTTQAIPYGTSYVEDAALMPGQTKVSQGGQSGYKVTTYKELRLNGEVVSKEIISNDTYSPMRRIVKVAPGQIPVPPQV